VVLSQICSFHVKISNSLFLANIFVIFGQNWFFDFFFKTLCLNAFKFDVRITWVVPSQICSFHVKISNFLFLVNIFIIFGQNWYFQLLLQNCKSECFQIWYLSTLGGSLSDLFILYQNTCSPFLVKIYILNYISNVLSWYIS